ncbi:MAG: HAMP domain-containing sensor histidine kinase, partial [Bacteroidota bacterium]
SCLMRDECYILSIYFPDEKNYLTRQMIWWLVLSAFFLLIVIISFSYVVMNLFRQKKLSEMKTDFVNNMTHEFKTPIATISLASEMLLKPNVHESSEKTVRYANIIYDENSRLKNQVEQVLQIAVLDRGTIKLKKKEIKLHEIIEEAAESFEMLVKQREGKLHLELNAKQDTLEADPVHIFNIINNLLDNANKYSPETPDIRIKTWNEFKGIMVSVEDKGIGISQENQKHVFKKFYRVHTGNIHDVKGFGLGLFYLKTIVEAHDGTVFLHSELKKGTRFEIFLPIVQK